MNKMVARAIRSQYIERKWSRNHDGLADKLKTVYPNPISDTLYALGIKKARWKQICDKDGFDISCKSVLQQ